jgi:hypothetical protein
MASIPLTVAALLFAQFSVASATSARLAVTKSEYRIPAGQTANIGLTAESRDFITTLARLSSQTAPPSEYSIAVGNDRTGHTLFFAVPLAMPPGRYTVTLAASNETGDQRTATISVTVDPLPPVAASSRSPVFLLNGWQFSILDSCPVSTSSYSTFGQLEKLLHIFELPGQTIQCNFDMR